MNITKQNPPLRKPAALVSVSCGVLLLVLSAYPSLGWSGAEKKPAKINVNRTVPKVEPPRPGLHFSAKPTSDEIFQARIFAEPLVPNGKTPNISENADLVAALTAYSKRSSPDEFAGLTTFLSKHPDSAWRASLLLNLGMEYYNTAHYSLALQAWVDAWGLSKKATDAKAKAVGDRTAGELAGMYARLGRMTELEALLNEVKGRVFVGSATERIAAAEAGLENMRDRPEIAFKCGPMALHRIKISLDPKNPGDDLVKRAASTQNGLSLPQVAELSEKMGLNYQMAFRDSGAPFVVPAVVHWNVGHYAALIRQDGDRFLVQDPTFLNDVWATRQALEAETSGYFLIPSGKLKSGWRKVDLDEGSKIWGKGNVGDNDPNCTRPDCPKKPKPCKGKGMAEPSVHLMLVSLNIVDEPVGYTPPVGPEVRFPITYNQREANQPTTFNYANFGPKWTFDWVSYISDNPLNPAADVKYFNMGGGTSVFTGFNSSTQSFAPEQYAQDNLTRTSASTYEMISADGSKKIFGQTDGSTGTTRRVFLTQLVDPNGNALTLTYDSNFRVVAITDAIGQVSTISYTYPVDIFKITKITDPFGRFATFEYDSSGRLSKITDVINLTSQFGYESTSDFINSLTTPYGTTTFTKSQTGTTRVLETQYPNGEKERVEFNQSTSLGVPASVPASQVPLGMLTHNDYLYYRNTYYWSRDAYADAYPDYTKARIYHWLHTSDVNVASGILESEKQPLEGRVWYDYPGQTDPIYVGTSDKPAHVGRVLSDGTTQIYTYEYNSFGLVTKSIDPLGRTFTYVYAPNGLDLLEERQTRAGNNELLSKRTFNNQHQPLTDTDASGQTATYTYNARGQLLTETNAKNQITTYVYDPNGYLTSVDGPLPGSADSETFTYDAYGRMASRTDSDGYVIGYEYDALDRVTKVTYPDSTFEQFTYANLDISKSRDRAGRETVSEYDSLRQLSTRTDPLNRVTRFEWCRCGGLKSITDPMGRTTTWRNDVQGRVTTKESADGSKISYLYDSVTSRLRRTIDEKSQTASYSYNLDDTVSGVSYSNTAVATPAVTFTYDLNYQRLVGMTDGSGTTRYTYVPISGANLGAGELDTIDGPLPNDTIKFGYDELQRKVSVTINGVVQSVGFDTLGRIQNEVNPLGTFSYGYAGNTMRRTSLTYPNGQTTEWGYNTNVQDRLLQRITNKKSTTPLSEFLYTYDIPQNQRIHTWSQQIAAQTPSVYTLGYDNADQLISASISSGGPPNSFGYSYDLAGNRLSETIDAATTTSNYNTLNELTSSSAAAGAGVSNEWDAEQRLAAVNSGNQRTEFTYDGMGRRVRIRKLINGSEVSDRRFVWVENEIAEERNVAGTVTKRYFPEGVKIETGPTAGVYFYTLDHLNSVRELTDSSGTVRARYSYDPFGRATKLSGDLDADFGFAGMFWSPEANLNLTKFRAYNPAIGRWLSRDPLNEAELETGPNLYVYVDNNPVNLTDPLGLCVVGTGLYCTDPPTCKDNPGYIFCTGPKPPPKMPAPCARGDEWCTGPKPPPDSPTGPKKPDCVSGDTFDPWCNKKPQLPDGPPPSNPPPPPPPPPPPKPKPPPKPPKKPPPKPPCKK